MAQSGARIRCASGPHAPALRPTWLPEANKRCSIRGFSRAVVRASRRNGSQAVTLDRAARSEHPCPSADGQPGGCGGAEAAGGRGVPGAARRAHPAEGAGGAHGPRARLHHGQPRSCAKVAARDAVEPAAGRLRFALRPAPSAAPGALRGHLAAPGQRHAFRPPLLAAGGWRGGRGVRRLHAHPARLPRPPLPASAPAGASPRRSALPRRVAHPIRAPRSWWARGQRGATRRRR